MEFLRIKKDIPFMGHALIFNVISALTFVAAVFFLVYKGLHVSIEFAGGTLIEVTYSKPADLERVRKTIEELGYTESQVQSFGTAQDALIRLPAQKGVDTAQQSQEVPAALEKQDQDVKLQRVEFTGPQVGNELAHDGLMALAAVVIGIMGFFAFFQREFSLTVLAAVLAVLGYFVSETVLVFDRVCETFRDRRFNKLSIAEIMIHAITRTTSRTIIIHGSSLMMVLSMMFFGGATLYYFSVALAIGILFGAYSFVFVAAAVAMWLGVKREDLLKPIKEKDETGSAVV